VRNHNFSNGLFPRLGRFEIHGFLESPGFPFCVVVDGGEGGDVGEACDAIEAGGSEVELTCLLWLGGEYFVAL
jgi:hypothetical protein